VALRMNAIATAAIVVSLFAAVGAITGLYVLVVIVLRACIRPESVDASGADDGNRSRLRLPRPAEAMWPRDKANTNRGWFKFPSTGAERHDDAGTNV
jgi:hypothetical protein